MKQLLIFAFALLLVVSCNKQAYLPKTMTAQELKNKEGIVLPWLQYEGDEETTAPPNSNGRKKQPASQVQVTVDWSYDLPIDITGTTITGGVSENAYYASGQRFTDTTITDGAVGLWECNRWYDSPPGPGVTTTCQTIGDGFYRVFSADFVTYAIKLSYFKHN